MCRFPRTTLAQHRHGNFIPNPLMTLIPEAAREAQGRQARSDLFHRLTLRTRLQLLWKRREKTNWAPGGPGRPSEDTNGGGRTGARDARRARVHSGSGPQRQQPAPPPTAPLPQSLPLFARVSVGTTAKGPPEAHHWAALARPESWGFGLGRRLCFYLCRLFNLLILI